MGGTAEVENNVITITSGGATLLVGAANVLPNRGALRIEKCIEVTF